MDIMQSCLQCALRGMNSNFIRFPGLNKIFEGLVIIYFHLSTTLDST